MSAVSTSYGTYLSDLFNPQVVGDRINKKLWDYVRFSPLARIDNTLEGRPGNTITLPYYNKSITAQVTNEGQDIVLSKLTESTTTVTIKKIAAGCQITDEALLSAYGNPMDEAIDQIARAIADAVDNDMLAVMAAGADASMTTAAGAFTANGVAEALTLFGEDIDGDKVLLVNPASYEVLRKATGWIAGTDVAANLVIRGTVGMIYGCQVVVSNKLTSANCAYIVKPGVLAVYNKRELLVESDRDIINKSTVITADKYFANYAYNKSAFIKMPGQAAST